MKLLAIAAVILASASAYAQAPGEVPMGPPPGETPCAYSGGGAQVAVMANRWAVGLSAGSLSIAPKDSPDNKTEFAIGELSIRYRATYHLEVELALAGGQQKLQDGTQGDLEVNSGQLGLRYRFAADRHWNWWLGGGLGGISVTSVGATDQEKKDAQRPLGSLSIGLEHRWSQFALHAELRGFGVGQRQQDAAPPKAMPVSTTGGGAPNGGMTTPQSYPPEQPASPDLSGGMLTIGASYYF
ncbi:MAG: hypothetical protein JO257_04510 [Deltaproteobacteria bacterium]|nr:hypothetical protein [Deltaproteobacteria bacterium]